MTVPEQPQLRVPDRAHMRAGDADREQVAGVLTTAFTDGRITRDELDERLAAVWSSKTFGDLAPLTADLVPQSVPLPAVSPSMGSAGAVAQRTGADLVDTSVVRQGTDAITCWLGDHRRTGHWRLARTTTISSVLGDVVLDLREAVLESHECTIHVGLGLGSVKIIVPDGIRVESRVSTFLGDDKIKGMRPVAAGAPRIVLTGFSGLGDVTVLGPDHVSLGQRLGLTK